MKTLLTSFTVVISLLSGALGATPLPRNAIGGNSGVSSPAILMSAAIPANVAPPFGYLDNIAGGYQGSIVVPINSSIIMSGWALENSDSGPARTVSVFVDGILAGVAVPSSPRTDVVAQITGTQASLNCGWQLTLNGSGYTVGSHTVTAMATDDKGQQGALTNFPFGFTISSSSTLTPPANVVPPFGYLDSIAGGYQGSIAVASNSSIAISGWALENSDSGPAQSVSVFVDGVLAGAAVPTLPRSDVVAQITGKPISLRCGWSLSVNVAAYSVGPHMVTAVATDDKGQRAALNNFPVGFTIAQSTPTAVTPRSITVTLSDGSVYKGLLEKQ